MKKLNVLISVTALCIAALAAVPSYGSSDAAGEKVNCKKISIGTKKARITLPNGEKRIMLIDELEAYQVDGLLFEKKELYFNGKPTGKFNFMQLIKEKGNLSLYRNVVLDPELASADKKRDDFYLYQGDKMYMAVNRKALPNVLNYFDLDWSYR